MPKHPPFLAYIAEHHPLWTPVILSLRPVPGETTLLTDAGLSYHVPEDVSRPFHLSHNREVFAVMAQIAHAALGHARDRKQLSGEPGMTEAALVGFDRVAHVLANLVADRITQSHRAFDLPNIAFDGLSFRKRVEAATTMRDLRGLAIAACREIGPAKLAIFAEKLEVEGHIPNIAQLPELPSAVLDIKLENDERDPLSKLATVELPAAIEPLRAGVITLKAAHGRDHSVTAFMKATEIAAEILATPSLSPVDFAWVTLFMEQAYVISIDRGLVEVEDIFTSIDAYSEKRAPFLIDN